MLKTTPTKIREATEDDIFDILVLAKEFSKEAPSTHKWDKDKTEAFLNSAILAPNMCIFVIDHGGEIEGAIVGIVAEVFISHRVMATELAWFVSEEYRGKTSSIRLVKRYEDWAKEMGANSVGMSDISQVSDLEKLYNRLGYQRSESVYLKEI